MNAMLAMLALGQISHQRMNQERLDEIIHLTSSGNDQDIVNGFDSYIVGALGPFIVFMSDESLGPIPEGASIEDVISRIGNICRNLAKTGNAYKQ